ncbi:MAG: hypothetical protein EB078_02150 [Proteobacteria bacterium]|nr:hypothetical protein [Pseudomonadota bacterium]NDC23592.1 hypothetical protein [Pseudomonadota bacterium]NDD03684.1 hypothetical protein [Pseudomonadota bacterium]NDG25779.1 hypothetical protein [Pseudomonadota bacterium]
MSKKIMIKASSGVSGIREIAIAAQLISPAQVSDLDRLCAETGVNFATAMMFKGVCSDENIAKLLEDHLSIRRFPLKSIPGLGKIRNLISEEKSKELQVFPLTLIEESGQKVLLLGMTDPTDLACVRKIEFLTHMKVQPAFLPLDDLQSLYLKFYRRGLEIFPVEVTFYGEKANMERARALTGNETSMSAQETSKVTALTSLLIRKGVITASELEAELKKLSMITSHSK